jgi:hypothetical protein
MEKGGFGTRPFPMLLENFCLVTWWCSASCGNVRPHAYADDHRDRPGARNGTALIELNLLARYLH